MEIDKIKRLLKRYGKDVKYLLIKVKNVKKEKVVKEDEISISFNEKEEYGVFAYNNGIGYAYSSNINDLEKCIKIAIMYSRLSNSPYKIPEQEKDEVEIKEKEKWEDVSNEEKINFVREIDSRLKRTFVKSINIGIGNVKEEKALLSNLGMEIIEKNVFTYAAIDVYGRKGDRMERITYSKELNGGFEVIKEIDTGGIIKKLEDKLYGKSIKPGIYDVVLDNKMTGVLIHEALGHALEGDAIARKWSVFTGMLNKKVAHSRLSVIDKSNYKGSFLFKWDDEGVKNKEVKLIENGIIRGFLNNISSAIKLNTSLTGNGRSGSYKYLTLPRMSNLIVEKGPYKKEEVLKLKDGFYLVGFKGGVTNVKTGEFEFYPEVAYKVRKGEVVRSFSNVTIAGNIKTFLKKIVRVGNDVRRDETRSICGKEGQYVKVVQFAPHIRVKGVYLVGH